MQKTIMFICMFFSMPVKNSEGTNPFIVHKWQLWKIEKESGLPFDKALAAAEKKSFEEQREKEEKIERLEHSKKKPINRYTEEYRKQAKRYSDEQEMTKISNRINEYLQTSPEEYWKAFEEPNIVQSENKHKNETKTLEQEIADIFVSKKITRPYAQRPSFFPHLKREPDEFGTKPNPDIKFTGQLWKKLEKVAAEKNVTLSETNIPHQRRTVCDIVKPHHYLLYRLQSIGENFKAENSAVIHSDINFSDIDGLESPPSPTIIDTKSDTAKNKEPSSPPKRPLYWLWQFK